MSLDLSTIWNGAYGGLYHEVVFEDCYRVKMLDFIPDLVIDLGANVGTFTKMAHELWPQAQIIAVEPDPDNCEFFIKNIQDTDNIHLIKAAIGRGDVYRHTGANNGSGESYVSPMIGYIEEELIQGIGNGLVKTNLKTTNLNFLVDTEALYTKKFLLKIDIEGAENFILTDKLQMFVLQQCEYVAIEIHNHALHAGRLQEVKQMIKQALQSLETTHDCEYIHPMFYARKKK